jgi:hypothetical protein
MRSVITAAFAGSLAAFAQASTALADEPPDPPRMAGQALNMPLAASVAAVVLGVAIIAIFLIRRRER